MPEKAVSSAVTDRPQYALVVDISSTDTQLCKFENACNKRMTLKVTQNDDWWSVVTTNLCLALFPGYYHFYSTHDCPSPSASKDI